MLWLLRCLVCSLGSSVPSRLHGVPLRLLRCLILPPLHSFYCYVAQCDAPSAAASLGVLLRLLRRLVCSFGGSSRSLPRLFGRFGVRLPVAACCARCARQAAWSLGVVRGKRWSLRNAPNPAGPFTPRTVVGTAVQHCLMSEASVHRQCLMSEALVLSAQAVSYVKTEAHSRSACSAVSAALGIASSAGSNPPLLPVCRGMGGRQFLLCLFPLVGTVPDPHAKAGGGGGGVAVLPKPEAVRRELRKN